MERSRRVEVGDCRCPGSPHREGDWVDLAAAPTVPMGAAVFGAIRAAGNDQVRMLGLLARIYIQFGIVAWSFVDEDGRPVPIDAGADDWEYTVEQLLPWDQGGMEVAGEADDLYSAGILRGLQGRTSKRSLPGPMDGSTSATQASSQEPQEPSPSSSRTSSAGKRSGATQGR